MQKVMNGPSRYLYTCSFVLCMCAAPGAASGQDLMGLLEDGPVVMVQHDEGEFDQCTAIIRVDADKADVWDVITDFESHTEFMPKLRRASIESREGNVIEVSLVLQTPGRNTRYVMAYELDRPSWRIDVEWVSGDLEGTFGQWRLLDSGDGGTLLHYIGATRNYSRFLQRFDDDQQTITIGVNVSSAIAMVRAVKERTEELAVKAGAAAADR